MCKCFCTKIEAPPTASNVCKNENVTAVTPTPALYPTSQGYGQVNPVFSPGLDGTPLCQKF